MSKLYTQINQAAAEQQEQVKRSRATDSTPETAPTTAAPETEENPQKSKLKGKTGRRRVAADRPTGSSGRTAASSTEQKQASNPDTEASSLLDEMQHGVEETTRPTERYSFQIFSDQKEKILQIQLRYAEGTGKQLSKSRVIREALDAYFAKALLEQ